MITWKNIGSDGYSTTEVAGSLIEVWREGDSWSLSVEAPMLPEVLASNCDTERLAKGMAERIALGLAAPNPANGPHVEPPDTDIPYEDGPWNDPSF